MSAEFCLNSAKVNWKHDKKTTSIESAVWWSGGIFPRTACDADGTNCVSGDCNASPNSNCPVGKGGNNPATAAEFTLQREGNDFYDITVINGANASEQMAPIPAPTATPGAVSANYWCLKPGSVTSTVPGSNCDWNFGKYVMQVPYPDLDSNADYQPLLLHSSLQCDATKMATGCPAGYTCTGKNGACLKQCKTDNDCAADNLSCEPGGNGQNYCQCTQESDCSGKGYCGTQFIPGIGPGQVFLQQCGSFAGWWTVDDLCASADNNVGSFNCGKLMTDGDGKSQTNLASLLGCTIKQSSTTISAITVNGTTVTAEVALATNFSAGQAIAVVGVEPSKYDGNFAITAVSGNAISWTQAGAGSDGPYKKGGTVIPTATSTGNATSCYNADTTKTYPTTCCGCATFDQGASSLGQFWPTNSTEDCSGNDTIWVAQVQPFLVNLKRACPTAYSYPYDDPTSTYQCRAEGSINMLGYSVTFGDLVKPTAP
ncbi:MAG: thaumatin family protein [Candidatus Binataceae bacterium]